MWFLSVLLRLLLKMLSLWVTPCRWLKVHNKLHEPHYFCLYRLSISKCKNDVVTRTSITFYWQGIWIIGVNFEGEEKKERNRDTKMSNIGLSESGKSETSTNKTFANTPRTRGIPTHNWPHLFGFQDDYKEKNWFSWLILGKSWISNASTSNRWYFFISSWLEDYFPLHFNVQQYCLTCSNLPVSKAIWRMCCTKRMRSSPAASISAEFPFSSWQVMSTKAVGGSGMCGVVVTSSTARGASGSSSAWISASNSIFRRKKRGDEEVENDIGIPTKWRGGQRGSTRITGLLSLYYPLWREGRG